MPHAYASPSGISVHKIKPQKGASFDFGTEFRGTNLEIFISMYRSGSIQLPVIDPAKIKRFADGMVIDDLETAREIVYKLQRSGIVPELVFAVD
jgi:hypothetical protein